MTLKKTEQAPPCSLSNKFVTVDAPANLSEKYVVLCPAWFKEILQPNLMHIDSIEVRFEEKKYHKYPEDIWLNNPEYGGFTADVWQAAHHCEKLIYVPHQGRLYTCDSIIDAAIIVEEIKSAEALKIIGNNQ